MAEKKYVSLSKLTKYDELLKAKMATDDAQVLVDAKAYADSLADNYEHAGTIATAKTELQNKIDAVEAKADTASAANTATQSDLDKLEALVGILPEDATATDVVGYVDEKTAGIATDATVNALAARVGDAEDAIDAIEADYLKAEDKTELNDLIVAEKTRAEGIESGLRTDVNAIKADYLKGSDKTALEASIAAAKKAGDDAQADIDAFLAAAEVGDAAVDTLKEIQDYITSDGAAAATMTANITANANAISALDDKVGDIPEDATATDVVAYVQEVVGAEETRATNAESGLNTRLAAVESAVGSSGSVATDIATAKQEAIDSAVVTAAADATTKANKALSDAKTYTDTEVGKDRTRLDALETSTHTHTNKAELDLIATGDKAKWDDAANKAHTHDNKTVLDGITATKVSAWDKVSAKADQTALQSEIDRAKAAEEANAAAIAQFEECSEAEINALFA